MSTEKKTWHVREIGTGNSIDTIEVEASMSDRQEERLLRGMLTNMNREQFYKALKGTPPWNRRTS